jgi:hypothetical protein
MSAHGSISLWDIEQSVLGLSEIIESPDTTDDEKQAARGELERWAEAEVAKVDKVRGFLKHCTLMASAAYAESKVMAERQAMWEGRARRLKEICLAVMDARGVKRLEGQSGVLRIQANGGKQALKITNEGLVPDEYCETTVTFRTPQWNQVVRSLSPAAQQNVAANCRIVRAPKGEAIRAALDATCKACGGSGGAVTTSTIGTFIRQNPCANCNGTGHGIVPGAELAERGQQLRVE